MNKKVEEKKEGTAVAAASEMPAYLVEAAAADAGKGVSTDQADNLVPLIYVLQPLSPQVDRQAPEYIEGAEVGQIWLKNAAKELTTDILVQPVRFWKDWGEWVPRDAGGGFVARHPSRPATAKDVEHYNGQIVDGEDVPDVTDAVFTVDPVNRQKVWKRPNGNDLVQARNHAVYVHADGAMLPYIIPLKGTGHAVSKGWMGKMMSKTAGGKLLPSFACLYRLTTRQRQNKRGKWYQLEVADAGYVTAEQYAAGRQLHEAFETGAVRPEAEQAAQETPATPKGDMGDEIPF